VRTRLLNSPTKILLTILGMLLLCTTVILRSKFRCVDAVGHRKDRNACLAEMPAIWSAPAGPESRRAHQLTMAFYPRPSAERQLDLRPRRRVVAAASSFALARESPELPDCSFSPFRGRVIPDAWRGLTGFGVRWEAGICKCSPTASRMQARRGSNISQTSDRARCYGVAKSRTDRQVVIGCSSD